MPNNMTLQQCRTLEQRRRILDSTVEYTKQSDRAIKADRAYFEMTTTPHGSVEDHVQECVKTASYALECWKAMRDPAVVKVGKRRVRYYELLIEAYKSGSDAPHQDASEQLAKEVAK